MYYFLHFLLLVLLSSISWAEEATKDAKASLIGGKWENTRNVDLKALRRMSIDAYLEGREYTV